MFNLLFFLGLVTRFLLIPVPGFKADIAFWKGWGLAMADRGIIWLVKNTNYNYPPGFTYVLYLINKTYALFKNPYIINEYWLDNNVLYLFLIKLITIVADIGIVFLILKIAKKLKSPWGPVLALVYFLNPVTILNGVIWGQVDQFGLFIFLASAYFLLIERPRLATVIFTVSWLMKFQNIIFIPLFYLFIYKKYSLREMIISLKYSFIVFLLAIFPFWFYREMESLIRLLTINSDWFPWYSLNAFNIWWLLAGTNGLTTSDKTLFIGIVNAKQFGLLLFSLVYFIGVVSLFFSKKEKLLKQFFIASTLVVFAFFHLLTQSHERYLFPLLGLIPLIIIYNKEENPGKMLVFIVLISLASFMNMYISIALNYPDQVIWPFTSVISHNLSIYLALFQIVLFIYFLQTYFFSQVVRYWFYIIPFSILLFGFLVFKNINYLLGKPISPTEIQPIHSRQDYLSPVYDKTVESARGPNFWNRLSNNYYFYEHGIGSHADSEIIYGLGGRFSRFKTDFGIDTEGAAEARASFIILGDGQELFRSKVLGRFDLPNSADVNITGVDKLELKIVKAGESNYGDHADWLNPILMRQ